MVASMDQVDESGGSNRDIIISTAGSGDYDAMTNSIEWTAAPAWGTVQNSASKNPDDQIVALGSRVTVTFIGGAGYSGNVFQKGLFGDPGQIKLQVVPDDGGTFGCRFEGVSSSLIFNNDQVTNVDDGDQHTAICIRNGDNLKVIVDGVEESRTLDVGLISNDKNLTMGNKGSAGGTSDQHFGKNTCSAYAYGAGAITYVKDELDGNC
jgi:hypothetical protein